MTEKEKVVKIASEEIGYKEQPNGWTKYGQWFANRFNSPGLATQDWCNMFITWCMRMAGVPDWIYPDTMAAGCNVGACSDWLMSAGFQTSADDMPQPGDLVIYTWGGKRSDGLPSRDHIGICETVTGNSADDAVMVVIEGNKGNAVARREIAYRDPLVYQTFRPSYLTDPDPVEAPFEMRKGDQGDSVQLLQMALDLLGADLEMDGIFGAETDKALRMFQADAGLDVDGIAGTDTWTALIG